MPRGNWIAHVEVTNSDQYVHDVEGAKAAFEKYGATFLARGGQYQEPEGALDRSRRVVVEFLSYQSARKHRLPAGTASITLTEEL